MDCTQRDIVKPYNNVTIVEEDCSENNITLLDMNVDLDDPSTAAKYHSKDYPIAKRGNFSADKLKSMNLIFLIPLLFILGATTGYTLGCLHSPKREQCYVKTIYGTEFRSFEFGIVSIDEPPFGFCFGECGDSGSLVFDPSNGAVIGLLFATCSDEPRISFITPFNTLQEIFFEIFQKNISLA